MRITAQRSETCTAILTSLKRGYAVAVMNPDSIILKIDLSERQDDDVTVERLDSKPLVKVLRRLEQIREEFDENPNGCARRLVVISAEVAHDDRSRQFMRRSFATINL